MATGALGLEAPATHQLPCSRRAARRFAWTWGLVGRLLHRGIIGVDEALQRIQRSICEQAPVDPVLLDAQLRAADQVPSLYFHLKHNRDAGRLDSKARAATFHARPLSPRLRSCLPVTLTPWLRNDDTSWMGMLLLDALVRRWRPLVALSAAKLRTLLLGGCRSLLLVPSRSTLTWTPMTLCMRRASAQTSRRTSWTVTSWTLPASTLAKSLPPEGSWQRCCLILWHLRGSLRGYV